uniref:MH1 domain-containing protein n=1 Tax=Steinernema glaseri TaxID=37863 RepID=A0A1I8AUX8_9BILA
MLTALSTGMKETPCVTFPKTRDGRIQIARQKHFPPETFFRLFRNAEVRTGDIGALPECYHNSVEKGNLVCVNPYHYRECRSNEPGVPLKRRRRRTVVRSRLDALFSVAPLTTSASYAQSPWTPVTRIGQQQFTSTSTTMYNTNNVFYAAHRGPSHGMAPFIYDNQFAYLQDSAKMMFTPSLQQPTFYPQDCFQVDHQVGNYASDQFRGAEGSRPCRIRLASEDDDATRNEPLDIISC